MSFGLERESLTPARWKPCFSWPKVVPRSDFDTETSSSAKTPAAYYEDVPLSALIPAYVLSELKTAFLIGFQIYLPFLVIEFVVGALLSGMGLLTVSPAMVVVPCKLLLFVAADGWFLVVQMLLDSLTPLSG